MSQTTPQLDLIDRLRGKNDHLKAENRYLRAKVVTLEERLEQRKQKTVSHYDRIQPWLQTMRDNIFQIFLQLPSSRGLLHEEIIERFEERYPAVNSKNVPRRVRELCDEGKLWSRQDPDCRKVRFYLKLKE